MLMETLRAVRYKSPWATWLVTHHGAAAKEIREFLESCLQIIPATKHAGINLLSLLILTLVTSHNVLFLQSLPNSIPYRQGNVRRRKDEHRLGTAARGSLARLSRLP